MRSLLPALLVVGFALLGGCGPDDEGDIGVVDAPPVGSDPTDRSERAKPSARALVEDLAARVASGQGIADASWTRTVQDVGLTLWPDPPEGADAEASSTVETHRRDHTNLSHIAGDMTVQLQIGGAAARASWQSRDPTSLEIHDAFVKASDGGVDTYRRWVETAGHDLLAKRVAAIGGGTEGGG